MITNAEKILAAGLATAAFIATMFLLLVRMPNAATLSPVRPIPRPS